MKLTPFGLILLVGCMVFPVQSEPNRAWATQETSANRINDKDELEAKRIKECEIPNRSKPRGEFRKVSQLCGKALSLPKPIYPEKAKADRISGTVVVDVVTNEEGSVIWAKALSGPELLRNVSEKAACRARYSPTLISGRPIQIESTIQYFFVAP